MKKIYLVLTYTGTVLSKIIKMYTGDHFSHVSIALDPELEYMYSFGRLNPYNPFFGGLIHEKLNSGNFKRFKNTEACIYSLEIEDYKHQIIKETIEDMYSNKKIYKFNVIGLFAVSMNKKVRFTNSFYCAEFVKYILEKSFVTTKLPLVIRPVHFKDIKNLKEVYNGKLRDYSKDKTAILDYGA